MGTSFTAGHENWWLSVGQPHQYFWLSGNFWLSWAHRQPRTLSKSDEPLAMIIFIPSGIGHNMEWKEYAIITSRSMLPVPWKFSIYKNVQHTCNIVSLKTAKTWLNCKNLTQNYPNIVPFTLTEWLTLLYSCLVVLVLKLWHMHMCILKVVLRLTGFGSWRVLTEM